MPEQFEKHARTVTLLTLVSRVTGLARDAALARVFGVTALMDAFWFAFMVPNLFRRLFGEGALSASFLPVFAQLDRDDPKTARQLATLVVSLLILSLGAVVLAGEGVLFVLSMLADHENDAIRLTMLMLPYAPLVCAVAILGAILHVRGRFGPTAAAPVVLNLFIVAAAIGAPFVIGETSAGDAESTMRRHIAIVALAVTAAGAVQVAWSLLALRGTKWWAGSLRNCREAMPALRRVLAQAWPMFLGLGVLQINVFIDDLIASYPTTVGPTIFGLDFPLQTGALTSVNAAQRLYEFPLGVFGIAVATAIFPALSRANHDEAKFADILRRGLRLVMFIGLPASVGLILVRQPLTAVVFQGAAFTADDTARVAFVLLGYTPAIWAYSMTHTLTRAFYARGDSMTPVKVAVGMVLLNFALNISLIWTPLREAGLAWSTSICATVQVMILLRLTRRYASQVVDRSVIGSWLRTFVVTAVMAGVVWGIQFLLPDREATWSWAMLELCALVGAGGLLVLIASWLARMPELRWALGRGTA
jgi:putative peptidoglycan lipid II flippase